MPFFIITILGLLAVLPVQALPSLQAVVTPDVQNEQLPDTRFPKKLEEEGNIKAAWLAWRQIAYKSRENDLKELSFFHIARLHLKLNEKEKALQAFSRFGQQFPQSAFVPQSLYLMGAADPKNARHYTALLHSQYAETPWAKAAQYRDFWQMRYQGKAGALSDHPLAAELNRRVEAARLPKSKALAFTATGASIVPGLGHAYLKDFRTAALAFVFNALFLWATFYAFKQRHWPYVVVFGLVASLLYTGTIFSAKSLAYREAKEQRETLFHQWQDLWPKAPDGQKASVPVVSVRDHQHPLQAPLWFYRNVVGTFDGDRGNGWPVNSRYAQLAWQQHGPLYGTWMTVDRLLRDWREIATPRHTVMDGPKRRYWDPLERNTFWLES